MPHLQPLFLTYDAVALSVNECQSWAEIQDERVALTRALLLRMAGVRAMIFALGALRALSRMGVLGVVTYSAALSGSAWMQTLWMSMLGRVEVSICVPVCVKHVRVWSGNAWCCLTGDAKVSGTHATRPKDATRPKAAGS